jgi:hypothetical protein
MGFGLTSLCGYRSDWFDCCGAEIVPWDGLDSYDRNATAGVRYDTAVFCYNRGVSTKASSLEGTPFLLGGAHVVAYAPGDVAAAHVLLVGPLLEEGRCAHRAMHRAAVAMAAGGATVLRVELAGTGNSDGEASMDGWLANLRAGIDWLRARGEAPLVVIGCRAGALLAARVAEGADRLVLWQPVLSGKSYLREIQVRRMAQDSITGEKPPTLPFEVEGQVLTQAMHEALGGLKLPDAKPVEDVRLVQCSFSEKLLAEYERLAAAWGIAETSCVVAEKFWLPHTPGGYGAVVAAVAQHLTPQPPSLEGRGRRQG